MVGSKYKVTKEEKVSAENWFSELRDDICSEFQNIEKKRLMHQYGPPSIAKLFLDKNELFSSIRTLFPGNMTSFPVKT